MPDPPPSTTRLIRHGGYRRLWTARTISQWRDTCYLVALALLIYHLTGSGLGVTGVVIAETAPVLLVGPIAGPLVDRWSPPAVMVSADLFRCILMVALVLRHDSTLTVYGIAAALSAGAVFFNPAAGAALPALVGESRLVAATSGIWTAAVVSQVALEPLAGLLVTAFGYGPAFTWVYR